MKRRFALASMLVLVSAVPCLAQESAVDTLPTEPVGLMPLDWAIIVAYAGPLEEADQAVAPLRDFGPPVLDLIRPMAYTELQALTEGGFPHGARYYWSADSFRELPDAAIEVLASRTAKHCSPLGSTIVIPGGGAASRIDDNATAFGQRSAPWNCSLVTAGQRGRSARVFRWKSCRQSSPTTSCAIQSLTSSTSSSRSASRTSCTILNRLCDSQLDRRRNCSSFAALGRSACTGMDG